MAAPPTEASARATSSTAAAADPPQALDSEEEETSRAKDKRTLPPTGAQKARRRRKKKKAQEKVQALEEEAPKDGKGKGKERAQTPPDTGQPPPAAARTRHNWAMYPEAQQCLIDVFRQYAASSTADRTAIKEAAWREATSLLPTKGENTKKVRSFAPSTFTTHLTISYSW